MADRDPGRGRGGTKGQALEGVRFRHPFIERDSPVVLGDYVTLEAGTGVVHTAPGHGWDDYLTGVRYGLDIYCPVDEAGRFLPEVPQWAGSKVFDANPEIVAFLKEHGAPARVGQEQALLPGLLALQEPDHLPGHRAVVHRPRQARLPREGPGSDRAGALVPGLGRRAHPQHDRHPARLVHLAPAALGRAHPGLLLQGLRRGSPDRRPREPRGRRVREGERRRLVRARREGPAPSRTSSARSVARPSSTRSRTSSTCGSTRAPRTPRSWPRGPTWPGRPTSTSKAATSTAAGSTRRC